MSAPNPPRPAAARAALLTGCGAGLVVFVLAVIGGAAQPEGGILTGIFAGLFGGLLVSVVGAWLGMRLAAPPAPPPPLDEARADRITTGLAALLAELEAARQATLAAIAARAWWRVPLGAALGVGLWLLPDKAGENDGLFDLLLQAGFGAALGYVWAASALGDRYRALYKARVLPVLAAGFGDLSWRPAHLPDLEGLRAAGVFDKFDHSKAEDELFGTHRGIPLSIVELRLTRGSGDDESVEFNGLLVEITLPRGLAGSTAIVAGAGILGSLRDWLGRDGRTRVRLEDPAFAAIYEVWSTDQIAARALLTPAFMTRLLALADQSRFGRPFAITDANRLTLALPRSGTLFEPPSYTRPAATRAALVTLHDDIAAVLAVADTVIDLDYAARAVAGDKGSPAGRG